MVGADSDLSGVLKDHCFVKGAAYASGSCTSFRYWEGPVGHAFTLQKLYAPCKASPAAVQNKANEDSHCDKNRARRKASVMSLHNASATRVCKLELKLVCVNKDVLCVKRFQATSRHHP